MPWWTVGAPVIGNVASGVLGGSDKGAERAAKDASAASNRLLEDAQRTSEANLAPFIGNGTAASNKLAQLYGLADPEGYAAKPTRQKWEDWARNWHFEKYGQDYNRNSNDVAMNPLIDKKYQKDLAQWEAGKEAYVAANPGSQGSGELLQEFTGNDLQNDPGYQFELDQGTRSNDAKAAAGGGFLSGAAQKEAIRYGNDFAGTKFNEAFSRDNTTKTRTANFLSSLAGSGQAAATGQAQLAANSAGAQGENLLGVANIEAAGAQADKNAWNGAIGGIVNAIGDYNVLSKLPSATKTTGGNPSYSNLPVYNSRAY